LLISFLTKLFKQTHLKFGSKKLNQDDVFDLEELTLETMTKEIQALKTFKESLGIQETKEKKENVESESEQKSVKDNFSQTAELLCRKMFQVLLKMIPISIEQETIALQVLFFFHFFSHFPN